MEGISGNKLIHIIQNRRGTKFHEWDIAWYLDQALLQNGVEKQKENIFTIESFVDLQYEKQSAMEKLHAMTGFKNQKRIAAEVAAVAKEKSVNEKLKALHNHMIFVGNPGTGKTTAAKILSDIMAEEGNTNATMIVADRQSLIGKYIGQTAPKIANSFQAARGGVLFVDEAGFFLKDSASGFTQEAMKEFVRFMELYQDVMVIFALYPGEVEAFLELDAGLSSRISRVVEFENYTEEELLEIMESMCKERGYLLKEDAKNVARSYLSLLCDEKKEQFGNAREARKLVESAIVSRSIRCFTENVDNSNFLNKEDLEESCCRLRSSKEKGPEKRVIGFRA